MKKLIPYFPFAWGLLAVALMAVGAGMVYLPAGFIIAGAALFLDLQLDRGGRRE